MLVKMKNGFVEELHDFVGEQFIKQGRAERVDAKTDELLQLILKAEGHGGPAATAGIEMAMLEQKTERANITFFRTPRSRG